MPMKRLNVQISTTKRRSNSSVFWTLNHCKWKTLVFKGPSGPSFFLMPQLAGNLSSGSLYCLVVRGHLERYPGWQFWWGPISHLSSLNARPRASLSQHRTTGSPALTPQGVLPFLFFMTEVIPTSFLRSIQDHTFSAVIRSLWRLIIMTKISTKTSDFGSTVERIGNATSAYMGQLHNMKKSEKKTT